MQSSDQITIKELSWGKITLDAKQYQDILIYNNRIEEREYERLGDLFGTGHKIGDWEIEKLLLNNPEIIIIGTGWMGVVEVPEDLKQRAEEQGVELKTLKSQKAVKEYNKLVNKGKKVNALIHSTC